MTHSNEICTLACFSHSHNQFNILKCHCFFAARLHEFNWIYILRTDSKRATVFIVANSSWYTFRSTNIISCIKLITNRIRARLVGNSLRWLFSKIRRNQTCLQSSVFLLKKCPLIIKDSWILNNTPNRQFILKWIQIQRNTKKTKRRTFSWWITTNQSFSVTFIQYTTLSGAFS